MSWPRRVKNLTMQFHVAIYRTCLPFFVVMPTVLALGTDLFLLPIIAANVGMPFSE